MIDPPIGLNFHPNVVETAEERDLRLEEAISGSFLETDTATVKDRLGLGGGSLSEGLSKLMDLDGRHSDHP